VIVACAQLLIESNGVRRRLFHEILITCPGQPETSAKAQRALRQEARLQDKPPQVGFERLEVEHALTAWRLARVDRRRSWLTRG
jgi:hypothetical protein